MKQLQAKRLQGTGMDGLPVRAGIAVMAQVSPALRDKVRLTAKQDGVSVSEWLRKIIVKELE